MLYDALSKSPVLKEKQTHAHNMIWNQEDGSPMAIKCLGIFLRLSWGQPWAQDPARVKIKFQDREKVLRNSY